MKAFIKEAAGRWQAETPGFFKKVIIGGVSLGTFGLGLKGAAHVGVELPHFLAMHVGHMISTGYIAGLVAKFAKVDVPAQQSVNPPDNQQ